MACTSTIKAIIFILFTTISSSIEVEFSFEISQVAVESIQQNRPFIVWRVPIGCDYSGFFVEVLNFLMGLDDIIKSEDELLHLDIGICSPKFLNTLAPREAKLIRKYQSNYIKRYTANQKSPPAMIDWTNTILIHHKLPNTPFPTFPTFNRPKIIIGRVMSESTLLPQHEIEYLDKNKVDYIWVPTKFHETAYTNHGINADRLFVINEPMTFHHYFASNNNVYSNNNINSLPTISVTNIKNNTTFRFLSVFKYEHRKGPDILLKSYWNAFTKGIDDVELVIRSYKPSWVPGTKNLYTIFETIARKQFQKSLNQLPRVIWISQELSRVEMVDMYKSASAFVLPTRGEGWCLPCVESMAMGLPILVTNFSGPTEYLNSDHSYPIPVHKQLNRDGTGEPNVTACTELMKHVYKNQHEARQKGKLAASFVNKNLSPNVIGEKVVKKLEEYLYLL